MKKYIFPFLVFGLLTACVEDEGNYNYNKLNEVDIQGIEESYAPLAYFDKVTISPVLSGSLAGEDLTNYDYQWHLCLNNHANHLVISDQKDLDWVADVNPGNYTLYFTVKDRATGLEKLQSTQLKVGSPYSRGFLVLGDNMEENIVGMDMISMPIDRDTVMIENVFENDLGLHGARELIYSGNGSTQEHHQYLWLLTDDHSYKLTYGEEFKIINELADMDYIEIETPHQTPMHLREAFPRQGGYTELTGSTFNRSRSFRGMIFDDVIVMCASTNGEYYAAAVNRYNAASTTYFKPYPMAFIHRTVPFGDLKSNTLFYDVDNQDFSYPETAYLPYLIKLGSAEKPWSTNLGSQNRTLLYAENGLNNFNGSNPAYLFFKDNDADNYYITYFSWYESLFTRTIGTYKSPLYSVNMAVATDIDKASHYMFSSNRLVLLYSVGNRLYQYDYANGTCIYHDFDGEITYLETEYSSACSKKEYFVATYNQSTGKGMIYKMEVSDKAGSGFTFLDNQQWETSLRVKDIEWKWA